MMRLTFSLLILAFISFSCGKSDTKTIVESVQTPVKSKIRFITQTKDSLLMTGGDSEGKGFIMMADASGKKFTLIADTFALPVCQAIYFHDRYVFNNEKAEIFYSKDLKSFFPHYLRDDNFVPTLHQQPGRCIVYGPDGTSLFIAGGGQYEYGLIQHSPDTFQSWYPVTFENELRTIVFTPGGTGWAGGFGILLRSNNHGETWERVNFPALFVTDIRFADDRKGTLATFDANFYYTEDGGNNWKKSGRTGKNGYVNKVKYVNDSRVVAIGSHGTICISNDGGKNWDCSKRMNDQNLYDFVVLSSDKILATGEKGLLWHIEL